MPRLRPALTFWIIAGLVLIAAGLALGLWLKRPSLTEEEVRTMVVATIQREAPASFYVTGFLDITATTTVENTKTFLPDLLNFNLGTTTARVRIPGRASYGFDVKQLRAQDISVGEDGVVRVRLPQLNIYSVEPDLEQMEVQTDVGWARRHSSSGRVEQQAIQHAQRTLRAQANQHLATADQPRINTARALEALLDPVLQAAGMSDPQFRFELGQGIIIEPGG